MYVYLVSQVSEVSFHSGDLGLDLDAAVLEAWILNLSFRALSVKRIFDVEFTIRLFFGVLCLGLTNKTTSRPADQPTSRPADQRTVE